MAINLSDNVKTSAPKLLDNRSSLNGITPYTSVSDAVNNIPTAYRAIGLFVLIDNGVDGLELYWFKDGVEDEHLVKMDISPSIIVEKDPDGGYWEAGTSKVYRADAPSGVFRGVGSLDLMNYFWPWEDSDGFLFQGPRGDLSILLGGYDNAALGERTIIIGGDYSEALGDYSVIIGGSSCYAHGLSSTTLGGYGLTAHSYNELVVGIMSTDYTPSSTEDWKAKDRLFVIGNGKNWNNKSDALIVLKDGTILAPSLTPALIDTAGDKALVTKEYLDSNAVKSTTVGEPTGSDKVINMVSLTQAEYDASTPNPTTFYIITDA